MEAVTYRVRKVGRTEGAFKLSISRHALHFEVFENRLFDSKNLGPIRLATAHVGIREPSELRV